MEKWRDLKYIGEQVLPPHADGTREGIERISLNGTWSFSCTKGVENRDADFWRNNQMGCRDTIQVPGCWETQGFGKPYYFACGFPKCIHTEEGHIPELEEDEIYVGQYQRSFYLSETQYSGAQSEERWILQFGSVKSAFYVWLNGQYIGMGKGSMLPVEFDVTGALKTGENLLSVEVYEFSDATYIEDQDMWHMAGIYRDVILEKRPAAGIYDLVATADFNEDFSEADLSIRAEVYGASLKKEAEAEASLFWQGRCIAKQPCKPMAVPPEAENKAVMQQDMGSYGTRIHLPKDVLNLWSAETPNLYEIKVTWKEKGVVLDSFRIEYGFRRVGIDGERLLINGMPLKLRGVNYHAFTPEHGYYVPKEVYERDLRTMKQNNINAIRTSHYPQDTSFYELCNRLGIYVMDECNVESHGVRDKNVPGDNPDWEPHVVDRMRRMVTRDRNHPCIVMWSLGNESESGENHHKMREAALELDQTRPIHYEGGADLAASDFVCVGYSSPEREKMFADGLDVPDRMGVVAEMDPNLMMSLNVISFDTYKDHPIVATEYMHSMGNSGSDLKEHTEVFEHSDRWCGGFIWDFKDKALLLSNSGGRKSYGYGGDFGPGDQPGTMCCNGLTDPAGIPHEQMAEVKKAYQPFGMEWDAAGHRLMLENRNSFLDLSEFSFRYEVARFDLELPASDMFRELLGSGALDVRCAPRGQVELELPVEGDFSRSGRYMLTVSIQLKETTLWADAGFEIAYGQWELAEVSKPSGKTMGRLEAVPGGYRIGSGEQSFLIDGETGDLKQIYKDGTGILETALRPNFWRAPTDADLGFMGIVMGKDRERDIWAKISLGEADASMVETKLRLLDDGGLSVLNIYKEEGETAGKLERTYRLTEDGLLVSAVFTAQKAPRRFGFQAEAGCNLHRMQWLGKGPHDTYWGRDDSGVFQWHEKEVADQDEHMRPQEHGSKRDVRIVCYAGDGARLWIQAVGHSLQAAAWPYTLKELHEARHIGELPEYTKTTLVIDGIQNGLGDAFVKLKDSYKIQENKEYKCSFLVRLDAFHGPLD